MPTPAVPVAERLLAASSEPSVDWRDLDWNAEPVAGAPWQPWEQVSLYATPLWQQLDEQERLELSRHEAAHVLEVGIWSENVLMQMLLRVVEHHEPRDPRARYALTEIGDECRHSLMFTRYLTVLDTPRYGPRRAARAITSVFSRLAHPVEVFAAALVVEEILDSFQRAALVDPAVQPLTRAVDRIHVVEEARHISFARAELDIRIAQLSAPARVAQTLTIAAVAAVLVDALICPQIYRVVGVDPRLGARSAVHNPHRRMLLGRSASRLIRDFTDRGLISSASRPLWRAKGLL